MKKLNYKLVCWGAYCFRVLNKYKWLAIDEDGEGWVYESKPELGWGMWLPVGGTRACKFIGYIVPPEEGRWETQIYWIG